jgi:hypothetical protein
MASEAYGPWFMVNIACLNAMLVVEVSGFRFPTSLAKIQAKVDAPSVFNTREKQVMIEAASASRNVSVQATSSLAIRWC